MGTTQPTNDSVEQSETEWNPIEAVRGSVLLKLAIAGGSMILLAAGLQVAVVDPASPSLIGVWTGMLPVWGTALISVGLGSYAYIWVQRR